MSTIKHHRNGTSRRKSNLTEPMMDLIRGIWTLRRDLLSDGFDHALQRLATHFQPSAAAGSIHARQMVHGQHRAAISGNLTIHCVPTGIKCWTWTVPDKWSVKRAYIKDQDGHPILDLKDHPLHVMSYSSPIDAMVSKRTLLEHLHTVPERPDAIPFRFSYYRRNWGFCIQHRKLSLLKSARYRVFIDSSFQKGSLKILDVTIPGQSDDTIVLVAHLCHPAMANDNLTGVAVGVQTAKRLMRQHNRYTYKLLVLPETIGSLAYLSRNEDHIPRIKYCIVLDMLGNDNTHLLQYSKQGGTRLDRIAHHVMKRHSAAFREAAFRELLGSDAMVFDGPGIDIPTITLSRWPCPAYHTSDDNPDIVAESRLNSSKRIVLEILRAMDRDYLPKRTFKGPICLSACGLWGDKSSEKTANANRERIFLRLEGNRTVFDIAEDLHLDFDEVVRVIDRFHSMGLVTRKYSLA